MHVILHWLWLINQGVMMMANKSGWGTALIYILFVLISLIAAMILFSILSSTAVVSLATNEYIKEAEFTGAFAGFATILYFLIKNHNQQTNQALTLRGSLSFDDNSPVIGAVVNITETGSRTETNNVGDFSFTELTPRSYWTVKAIYQGDQVSQLTVDIKQLNDSIQLPPLKKK